MVPTAGTSDHLPLLCDTPPMVNVNCAELPSVRLVEDGLSKGVPVTVGVGVTVGATVAVGTSDTVALPICWVLESLVAVTVMVCAAVIVAGAV